MMGLMLYLFILSFPWQEVAHILSGILSKFRWNSKRQNIFLSLEVIISWVGYLFFERARILDVLRAFGWVFEKLGLT